jgi:hypothetical protein
MEIRKACIDYGFKILGKARVRLTASRFQASSA